MVRLARRRPLTLRELTRRLDDGETMLILEDDLETDVLPAATTLDAFAQVPLGAGVGLVLRAENLWNERILTRNQGGSIDLGNPRTVWAGLRVGLR